MSTNNFLKGINTKNFFDGFVPLKTKTYCVIIIYDNGNRKEIYSIENPWQYMAVLRKNPRIKSCYIKDENND